MYFLAYLLSVIFIFCNYIQRILLTHADFTVCFIYLIIVDTILVSHQSYERH